MIQGIQNFSRKTRLDMRSGIIICSLFALACFAFYKGWEGKQPTNTQSVEELLQNAESERNFRNSAWERIRKLENELSGKNYWFGRSIISLIDDKEYIKTLETLTKDPEVKKAIGRLIDGGITIRITSTSIGQHIFVTDPEEIRIATNATGEEIRKFLGLGVRMGGTPG